MLFIAIIDIYGERLHIVVLVHRLEQSIEMCHTGQSKSGGINGVHLCDPALCQVGGAAHSQGIRFLQDRFHDRWLMCAQLQSINPFLFSVLHPSPGIFRGQDLTVLPLFSIANAVERHHPWCNNLVLGTPLTFFERPFQISKGNAPYRGDTIGQPQFVNVFGFRSFRHSTRMDVKIYNTGHKVFSCSIDFLCIARAQFGAFGLINRYMGSTYAHHIDYFVFFYHNVHWTARWPPGSIYQGHTTDNEAVVWTLALSRFTIGSTHHLSAQKHGYDQKGCQ